MKCRDSGCHWVSTTFKETQGGAAAKNKGFGTGCLGPNHNVDL